MQASVCVGNYATTPYYIVGLDVAVYSMEELCYCLKENAFLLDVSLMNDGLLKWMERECGLKELADVLYPLVHKQGSLSTFVTMILDYTGFLSLKVINEVEQALKCGAGLSYMEKRKSQIDYLVRKKRYIAALRGYDSLLEEWQKEESQGQEVKLPSGGVRAEIFYNKGVVFTRMFLYGQAAEMFRQACELEYRADFYMAYLAAKRMELSESEYVAWVAGQQNAYQYSLSLEKQLEALQQEWKEALEYKRLQERSEWRNGSNVQKYYNENERLTQVLKESYRIGVTE